MLEVIYISKPLTRGKAIDFAATHGYPNAIEREYSNGKNRRTKHFIFVQIVPKDKIALQQVHKVKESDVKEVLRHETNQLTLHQ